MVLRWADVADTRRILFECRSSWIQIWNWFQKMLCSFTYGHVVSAYCRRCYYYGCDCCCLFWYILAGGPLSIILFQCLFQFGIVLLAFKRIKPFHFDYFHFICTVWPLALIYVLSRSHSSFRAFHSLSLHPSSIYTFNRVHLPPPPHNVFVCTVTMTVATHKKNEEKSAFVGVKTDLSIC